MGRYIGLWISATVAWLMVFAAIWYSGGKATMDVFLFGLALATVLPLLFFIKIVTHYRNLEAAEIVQAPTPSFESELKQGFRLGSASFLILGACVAGSSIYCSSRLSQSGDQVFMVICGIIVVAVFVIIAKLMRKSAKVEHEEKET